MALFENKACSKADGGAVNIGRRDAPWMGGMYAHFSTYMHLSGQVANWRLFAFGCLAVAAIAMGGVVYIGAQSKFVPLLVEVDKLGRTVAVRALTGTDAITDSSRIVYAELFELIENLRTVTTDREANNRNLNRGFSRLTGAAANYVRTELRKAPPNEVGATKTVQVKVKTALRLSEKSWQVEWEEISYDLKGDQMGYPEKWKATLQYELSPGGEEESIRKNPIGFVVPELNWAKVIL
jgi:type IV secretion system protein VirB5